MNNRKGFTLVELLITIVIIGIVVSLGTYFILNLIENSKEEALELSKKSVLESAAIYADEFLDDTDWVSSNEEINIEKTCVNIQWLINKGYVKKEDFNSNNEDNKYKLNTTDIAVLKKDKLSKNISFDKIYANTEIDDKTCNNLLNVEIISTTSSTQSINISAKCSIKNIVQDDVTYSYCKNGVCTDSNENMYTWERLDHNSNFNISVNCISHEFGESETKTTTIKTKELPTPTINVNFTNAIINYRNNNNNITKKYSVNGSGVKNSTNSTFLIANNEYITESRSITLYGNSIENDVTITATNSDGYNSLSKTAIIHKPEIINVLTPVFEPSDEIESGSWHNSDFTLSLTSNNSSKVSYYYGLSPSTVTNKYENPISISTETNETTYYAKACLKNDCSDTTSYIVKLDKTAPIIDIDMLSTTDNSLLGSYSSNTIDVSIINNIINKKISFLIKPRDLLSGLDKTINFRYNNAETTSYGSLIGEKNITLNNSNNGIINITQDGYRYFRFSVCDNANNCSKKDIKVKIDTTPPNVSVSIGYTNVSGSSLSLSCSGDYCTNDSWLNNYITLYFNANDLISGLNNNGIFKYNNAYVSSLDTTLLNIDENATFINGSWNRNINSDGNRYVTLRVCDNINNCTTKKVNFKIDAENPTVIIPDNGKKTLGDGSANITFNCETLSGVKTFTATDTKGGKNNAYSNDNMTYWHAASKPQITIKCKNNAGTESEYTYNYICGESFCCYSSRKDLYYNGSSINNVCSSTEKVYCGGIYHKRYTNCHTGGIFEYKDAAGITTTGPAINYREWSSCKSCDYILQFKNSTK